MKTKSILNNVKQYKYRDYSMEPQNNTKNLGNSAIRLPPIHSEDVEMTIQSKQIRVLRTLAPLQASRGKVAQQAPIAQVQLFKKVPMFTENPKERAQKGLLKEYGQSIDNYLKEMEEQNRIQQNHMSFHQINSIYRAKMVDWMVEVISAFKCSEQTFFLAVNLMDRYFDSLNQQRKSLELQDLHITGITCMFMASKYEDVYPLLMKTVFNKIAHQKISIEDIRAKELEILRELGFKIGVPTALEFLDRYTSEIQFNHSDKDFVSLMSLYLAKMAMHHEVFCYRASSLIAASAIHVAVKICEQMKQKTILTKDLFHQLLQSCGIKESVLVETSKKLLYLAQNFEGELPGLENLKALYIPQLNFFVQ